MNDSTCRYCDGHLLPQNVTRLQQVDGHWVVVENVPALVCEQCGETYFTPHAHDLLVNTLRGGLQPSRRETLDIFDLQGTLA